jgi:hypothetical protein
MSAWTPRQHVASVPQGELGMPGRLGHTFETGIEIETLVGILT